MPDLSTISSGLKDRQFTNPVTSERGGYYDGTKGSWIARNLIPGDSGFYDKGLQDFSTQTDVRYQNQGWIDAFGNFAGDVGVKTVSGIPAMVGGITGLGKGSFSALTGGNFSDGFDDNPFLNLAESINVYGTEVFPHFQEAAYQDMNFGQKLSSALGQLTTANVETVGFLAQSFGLAGLLGKAQLGTRLVNQLAKGKDFMAVFSELAAPNLAKIASGIDDVAMNVFLTTNESAMEAMDSKETVRNKLQTDRIAGLNNLSDEEIEAAANNSLTNVFWLNMLTGAATNGFFQKLVKPIYSKSSVASRANKLGLKMMNGVDDLTEKPTYASGFDKFLFDEGHAASMVTKRFLTQGLSESLEEDIQYSIQKVNDAENTHRSFLESSKDLVKDLYLHGLDFSDDARLEATALGGLIGAGQVSATAAFGYGAVREARTVREAREIAANELQKSYTDFMSSGLVSKSADKKGKLTVKEEDGVTKYFNETEEAVQEIAPETYQRIKETFNADEAGNYTVPGEVPVDENGNVVIDKNKATQFAADAKLHSEFDNLIEAEASKEKADALKISLYQLSKLNNLAQTSFKHGTTDLLLQKLDSYTKLSPEKLQLAGIENPEEISDTVARWKKHVERLESNYLSTQNALISTGPPEEIQKYRDTVSQVGGRIVNLDTLIEDLDKEINDVITNNPNSTRLRDIRTAFQELDEVDELFPYKTTDENTIEETLVAELSTKRKDLVAAREELGTLYTKMMEPKKGFQAYKQAVTKGALSVYGKTAREKSRDILYNDNFSEVELENYLDKNAQILQHQDKIKVAKSAFFADAINLFVKYLSIESFTPESADSLKTLTHRILDNGYTLYPDEVTKLKGIITSFLDGVNTPYRAVVAAFEAEGWPESELEYYEAETAEDEALYAEWTRLREIKDALGDLDTDTVNVLQKLTDLEGFPEINTDESSFKLEAAKGLLNAGNRIVNASAWDGENISPDYDNLTGVNIEIGNLVTLINKGLNPLAKKDSKYKPVLKEAKKLLENLKEIQKKTKENRANKDLKNRLEDLHYANGVNSLAPDDKALKELIELDPILGAMATADLIAQGSDESYNAVRLTVIESARQQIEALSVFDKVTSPINFKLTPEEVNIIIKHPTKGFGGLFQSILRKEEATADASTKQLGPLRDFVKDYDVVKFTNALGNFLGDTTPQQFKDLLLLQTQLIGLQQIEQTKASGFNNVSFLNSVRDYLKKNPTSPTPSSSQIRVVRELALFNLAPNNINNEMFQNGAALKAPAGAGKSLVVSKLLKHVLKLSGEQIVTAAPQPLAAKNIKEALDSPTGPFTVTELTDILNAGTLDKGVKLIVVDEVGALLNESINKFAAAFAKYNRENPDSNVKFIFLYDPNQITPGNVSSAVIDNNFSAEPSISEKGYWEGDEAARLEYRKGVRMQTDHATLPFIENIQSISPLSVTYRSDVAEIVDLQNAYKTEQKVSGVESAASLNPIIRTDGILGSFVEKDNNIVTTFRKSELSNPDRTRSVIVGSIEKKQKYQALMPGAEVLTAVEAQGITRDEVYIDIEPTDSSNLGVPKVFNAWMYTAISRAVSYAHASNIEGAVFNEDRNIPNVVEKVKATKETSNASSIETLTAQIDTLSALTEDVPTDDTVAPEDVVEEAFEDDTTTESGDVELETPDYGDETVTSEEDSKLIPEGTHTLENPSSEVLENFDSEAPVPALQSGDEVLVVKDVTPKRDGTPATRFLILQPIVEDGVTYAFRKVGILSESEVGKFESNLKLPSLASLKGYTFQGSEVGLAGWITPNETIESSFKLFVQPTTADIKYVYAPTTTDDFSGDVDEEGKLEKLSILKTYFTSLYGPNPGDYIENYDEIINDLDSHTKIMSFRYKKDVRKWFPNAFSDKQRPKLGPPYLVIYGMRTRSGQVMRNQFIRLVPAILNRNTPDRPDLPLSQLYKFLDNLKRFETVLATSGLPGKLTELRNGKVLTVGRENYYPFHSFVIALAKAYRAQQGGKVTDVVLATADHLKTILPTVSSDKIPKEILQLAYELDVLVHGDVAQGETRAYNGPAQRAIDAIGKQNFVTTLPNGENLILRDYRKSDFNSNEKRVITHSSGFSLMGPIKFIRDKGLAYNAIIRPKLTSKLQAYRSSLESRGLAGTARYKFVDDILKTEGVVHLSPITTQQLQGLLVDSLDSKNRLSNVSEGFGIRTPIGSEFDASSEAATTAVRVKDILQTNYVKTIPTKIVVGTSANLVAPDAVEEVEPKQISPIQKLTREVRDTKISATKLKDKYPLEVVAQFMGIMEEDTFEKAVSEYRKNAAKQQITAGNKNIYQALKDVGASSLPLKDLLEYELKNSLKVEGVGKDKDKIASRDYIKGSVFVTLFNARTEKHLKLVSDLARTDYYSGKNRAEDEFNSALLYIANSIGMSDAEVVGKFNQIVAAYNQVNSEYKTNTPVDIVTDVEEIFDSLAQIVKLSSAVRGLLKNTEDPAIPAPTGSVLDFAKKLLESADNAEEFEALLQHPDNAKYKAELSKLTSDGDYYDAATKVVESGEFERAQRYEGVDQDLGDELTPAEVEELMNRINPPSLVSLFKRYTRKKGTSEVFRMFEFGQLMSSRGEVVWGLYKNGAINYALNANGKIGSRTVRHEMFHRIFWEYLTPAEQAHVLGLATEKWGNLDEVALEEKLAVDFETFNIDKKPNVFQVFWQKLMRLLGFTFNNLSSLEKFFSSIQGGVYNRKVNSGEVERAQINIAANFDNLLEYKTVKAAILSTFVDLETSRKQKDGKVLSFSEIILATFERLRDMRTNTEVYFPNDTQEQLAAKKRAFGKVLDNVKLAKSFVDTFFGQAQTRDTVRRLYEDRQQRKLETLLEEQEKIAARIKAGESLEAERLKVDSEISALAAETFDTELSDPAIKLTGNVKQRLISIRYLKDGVEDYAALGEAFSIILPRVASIPVDSMASALEALESSFKEFATSSFKTPSNIRTATGKFMLSTIRRIQNQFDDVNIRRDIAFRKDVSNKTLYAIVSKDGSPIGEITTRDVTTNPNKYVVIHQEEGGSMDTLIKDVATVTNTTYDNVAKAYYLFEDLDFIRSLLAAVSSLRENLPHLGIDEYNFGEYKSRYIRIKTGGGRQVHENYIANKFDALTSDLVGASLFPETLLTKVREAESAGIDTKKEVLKEFLSYAGIKRPVTEVTPVQMDIMFDGFSKALEALQEAYKAPIGANQSLEEYEQDRRGGNLLKSETKMLRNLVDVLNNHYQLSETHSYTRADGKKAYGWIDASYQSQLLTSIVRALDKTSKNLRFKKFSTFSLDKEKRKLVTTDRFLKDNILFKGINSITRFIDHDGLKTKGNDVDAVYLTGESLKDFRKRNIVFGFFTKLGFGSTYFQFLPIPSNRTTIQAVEVTALKKDGITKALSTIIKAQKNRPDPASNPDLANNKVYSKNWKQWKLAGLQGDVSNMTEEQAIAEIRKHVTKMSVDIAKDFQQQSVDKAPKIRIADADLRRTLKYFDLGHLSNPPSKEADMSIRQEYVNAKNALILKAIEMFYYNSIVNQYSASQLLYGDETFYKHKEDQTKRIQIVTATGDTLLTDSVYGIPPSSRVLVVDDLQLTVPEDMEGVLADSFRDTYDASDAEGFMLPEFYEKIARTYGVESLTDVVMKPVYFSIENGIPTAIKYSVKVLTDELVAKYPHLNTYREAMRKAGADQMVFASAVKVGLPSKTAKLDNYTGEIIGTSVDELSILTIDNGNLRFQLNPASDTDKDVTNLSQGTAYMNTNGLNFAETFDLHKLNSFVITNGLRRISRALRLTRKGGMSKASKDLLTKRIISSLEGLPGGRDVLEMLQAEDPETKRKASLNLPLISERVVSTISSFLTKATTGFKFEGSKLVLQADLGLQEIYDDSTGKWSKRKLEFRDKDGYCEVILPKSYEEFMKVGDTFLPGSKNGLVGFRIPSTNYHSLLPLKVVGFYPVPEGSKGNIVIAPSLIVYYHGSDYDVDSLFVIRKEKYKGKDINLNDIVSLHLEEHVADLPQLRLEANKSIVGFDSKGAIKIEGMFLHQYLEVAMNQVSKKIETLTNQLSPSDPSMKLSIPEQSAVRKQIEGFNAHLTILSDVAEASAKNHIIDLFSTNMLDLKNRQDLLTPITFKAVKGLRSETLKELSSLLETDEFMYDLQKAGLIQLIC
jgi:hypothetical protein